MKLKFLPLLIISLYSCSNFQEISGNALSFDFNVEIEEGEWIEIDKSEIRFAKPDTLVATSSTLDMYNVKVVDGIGIMAPSYTYTKRGANWINHKLTRGGVASNFIRTMKMLQLDSVYEFEGDHIKVLLSGKVTLKRKDGKPIKLRISKKLGMMVKVVDN